MSNARAAGEPTAGNAEGNINTNQQQAREVSRWSPSSASGFGRTAIRESDSYRKYILLLRELLNISRTC